MDRRTALAAAATTMTSALAGCATDPFSSKVSSSFESEHTVSAETVVAVSNRNGSVTVTQSADDKLRLSGEKRADTQAGLDSLNVEVIAGERFAVQVQFADESDFSNRRVDLTVAVPSGTSIDRAFTRNGNVDASGVQGDLHASTTNGSITLSDIRGFVRAETTNGNVNIENTTGLDGAQTSNGTVDAELTAMRGDVDCRSSNGSVTVRVGPDVSTAFRLSTNIGSAGVRGLDYTAEVERETYVVGSLQGGDGGGGGRGSGSGDEGGDSPTLSLATTNGDVTLRSA